MAAVGTEQRTHRTHNKCIETDRQKRYAFPVPFGLQPTAAAHASRWSNVCSWPLVAGRERVLPTQSSHSRGNGNAPRLGWGGDQQLEGPTTTRRSRVRVLPGPGYGPTPAAADEEVLVLACSVPPIRTYAGSRRQRQPDAGAGQGSNRVPGTGNL